MRPKMLFHAMIVAVLVMGLVSLPLPGTFSRNCDEMAASSSEHAAILICPRSSRSPPLFS